MFQQQYIDNYICKTVLNWVKTGTLKIFKKTNIRKLPVFSIRFGSNLQVHSSATKRARDICFFGRKLIFCYMRENQRWDTGDGKERSNYGSLHTWYERDDRPVPVLHVLHYSNTCTCVGHTHILHIWHICITTSVLHMYYRYMYINYIMYYAKAPNMWHISTKDVHAYHTLLLKVPQAIQLEKACV